MIIHHLLHRHKGQAMTMPMMTHQHGACTGDEIDLHLGQKPKLGGRYADDSLIYISYFVGTLYIHGLLSFLYCSCPIVYFSKHKKTKNISVVSLCLLFQLLALVCFTCYFWFDVWKIQTYFASVAISFCSCFENRKPKNICCSSSVL
jgi:hypothetical protein